MSGKGFKRPGYDAEELHFAKENQRALERLQKEKSQSEDESEAADEDKASGE